MTLVLAMLLQWLFFVRTIMAGAFLFGTVLCVTPMTPAQRGRSCPALSSRMCWTVRLWLRLRMLSMRMPLLICVLRWLLVQRLLGWRGVGIIYRRCPCRLPVVRVSLVDSSPLAGVVAVVQSGTAAMRVSTMTAMLITVVLVAPVVMTAGADVPGVPLVVCLAYCLRKRGRPRDGTPGVNTGSLTSR